MTLINKLDLSSKVRLYRYMLLIDTIGKPKTPLLLSSAGCTSISEPSELQSETELPLCSAQTSRWVQIWQTSTLFIHNLPRALPGPLRWTGHISSFPGRPSLWSSSRGGCQGKHQVSQYTGSFSFYWCFRKHHCVSCKVTRTRVESRVRSMKQRSSYRLESWLLH